MSRRTETSYKAESPGKLAPHYEAPGSGDTVNGAVVQRKFTHLIRGDLPDGAAEPDGDHSSSEFTGRATG